VYGVDLLQEAIRVERTLQYYTEISRGVKLTTSRQSWVKTPTAVISFPAYIFMQVLGISTGKKFITNVYQTQDNCCNLPHPQFRVGSETVRDSSDSFSTFLGCDVREVSNKTFRSRLHESLTDKSHR